MGWFDEQIKDRKRNDDDAFAEAFANMASAITGKRTEASLNNDHAVTKDAIDERSRVSTVEHPVTIREFLKAPQKFILSMAFGKFSSVKP